MLLIGNSEVGKTSILQRWSEDNFVVTHMPTIGKYKNTDFVDILGYRDRTEDQES